MLVAIDAGHGGRDPGAVGRDTQLRESEVNLDVSLRCVTRLNEMGHSTILTRDRDVFVAIGERVRKANASDADCLVSIHCNAHTTREAHGTETFRVNGVPAADRLARLIQTAMIDTLQRRDRGVKDGNFQIIRTSAMPSCLAEIAFISNPEEERLLADPGFRQKAASAIAEGVNAWRD